MRSLFLLLSCSLASVIFTSRSDCRTFTAQNGRTLEAELELVQGNYVKLVRDEDGQAIWVNSLLLIAHDQDFIRKQGEHARSLKARSLSYVVSASNNIDRMVEGKLHANGIPPNEPASDQQFLRRIYLDIIGRIPNAEEAQDFLGSEDPARRRLIIDKLLQSEGYVSHNYNFWADLLRAKSRMNGDGPAYLLWIKDSLRANKPYDLMVKELLGARGYSWENGAIGYFTRDRGMPLDNTAITTRIFLGTRVECAQCHNHPFEDWTRRQFYEMASYTYGVNTGQRPSNVKEVQDYVSAKAMREDPRRAMDYQQVVQEYLQPVMRVQGVEETRRQLRLPGNYQYEDAPPNAIVEPATLFGQELEVGLGESRRDAFVNWVISPNNDRFVRVIANRIWKRVMGVGVFEPVDDLRDDMEIPNPALMAYLEQEIKRLKFDLKQFQRILYNTRTYHRQMSTAAPDPEEPYYFPGPVVRRLSAEQLWDSMVAMSVPDIDERILDQKVSLGQEKMRSVAQGRIDSEPEDVYRLARRVVMIQEASKRRQDVILRNLAQAEQSNNRALYKSYRNELARAKQKLKEDLDATYSGTNNISGGLQSKDGEMIYVDTDPRWRGYNQSLVRASELPSPAPRGHFLGLFGQSDRDSVDNAHKDPVLTQVLALLNGPVYNQVFQSNSVLMQNISAASSLREKVDVMFLSTLSRPATQDEQEIMLAELAHYGRVKNGGYSPVDDDRPFLKGYRNVLSALLNTRQYMFMQ